MQATYQPPGLISLHNGGKMKKIFDALYRVLVTIGKFLDRFVILPLMGWVGSWMMARVHALKTGRDSLESWKAEALEDFKDWLKVLPSEQPNFIGPGHDANDILMLLREFATLRQEISLQNREQHAATSCLKELMQSFQDISRMYEQNTQGLEHLEERIRRSVQKETVLPFLSLRDVLVRGHTAAKAAASDRSFLRRPALSNNDIVDGYAVAILRLDRSLEKLGINNVRTIGHKFDPKTMHSVSRRLEPGRAQGIVLEEQRSGYVCGQEVIRRAEVVVNG
jgi:molecular chaperone GrpE